MNDDQQLPLFPELDPSSKKIQHSDPRSGTFAGNMKLPVHRWFRYSAGFSADWVNEEILKLGDSINDPLILDPFAGSGTTLIAADAIKTRSIGFEPHPFIFRVAKAKLNWCIDVSRIRTLSDSFLKKAKAFTTKSKRRESPLLDKCFTDEAFERLDALRNVFLRKFDTGEPENEIIWLCITSILRSCSTAGTAQWQYVLPNKKKSKVLDPFDAFFIKISQMISDISHAQESGWSPKAQLLQCDARKPEFEEKDSVDLVITSPPYPNNYDYADSTRLEMTFWGEIKGWSDLHDKVRQYLLRSCSQHSAKERLQLDTLLQDPILSPILDELRPATEKLAEVRLTRGGKKTYHTMAAAYFTDLGRIFEAIRPMCKRGSRMCFVIGDSAPYGIYLDVEKWLGELALAAGFRSYSFEKLRDRNIKWKNRKHRVPLKEGRLWIEG